MLKLRDKVWHLGAKTYVMGILNITPDSFSDGGKFEDGQNAFETACLMIEQGADIVDIGGQSTRPGSQPITADEEWNRIADLVKMLGEKGIPFSVDTFYPRVAEKALESGALMINDVSGEVSPEMAKVLKKYRAAWVLMSRKSTVEEVAPDIEAMANEAIRLGIAPESICLDPGIGFGKDEEQSLDIIRRTNEIKPNGFAYLMAASRKRCVGYYSGIAEPEKRDEATAELNSIAIAGGADIIRVHNVPLAVEKAAEDDSKFRR